MKQTTQPFFDRLLQKKTLLLLVAIFLLGLFFRVSFPGAYPLSFDQLLILEHGSKILQGDLIVLGPKTGPAFLFIGPLTYYLGALALWLMSGSAYALVGFSIITYIITSLCFLVVLKLFPLPVKNTKTFTTVLFCLYVVSPFFIQIDRTAWNPNLIFLSSAAVFFPTLKVLFDKKFSLIAGFTVLMGTGIGYQSHFSVFLIPPMLFILALIYRSKSLFYLFISSCIGLFISSLPTIAYDYTHQWGIAHGAIQFFTEKNDSGGTYFQRVWHTGLISLENTEKIWLYSLPTAQMYLVGIFITIAATYQTISTHLHRRLLLFSFAWMALVAALYAFYRGLTTPEYYFAVQFPAIFLLGAILLSGLSKKMLVVMLTSWALFIIVWFVSDFVPSRTFTLGTQVQAATMIKQKYSPESNHLIFDMQPIEQHGFEYLLALSENYTPNPKNNAVHIVYPAGPQTLFTHKINDVAIWDDSRDNPQKNYLIVQPMMIETPSEIKLLKYEYTDSIFPPIHTFLIEKHGQILGRLWLYPPKSHLIDQQIDTLIKNIQEQGSLNNEVGDWQTFEQGQNTYYVSPYILGYFFIAQVHDSATLESPKDLLRQIKVVSP